MLLLVDEPVFAGRVVPARLIGVIEARQKTGKEKATRNDRLLAVAAGSQEHQDVRSIRDLRPGLVEQIERFFETYHEQMGNVFTALGRRGVRRAEAILEEGIRAARGDEERVK